MNNGEAEEPWIRTPWRLLFEVTKIDRLRPWQINLAEMVKSLVNELERRASVDFPSLGVAVLTSSTIHRVKTETILKFDTPTQPNPRPVEFVPPPLVLPIRSEYSTTTLMELAGALEKVMADLEKLENKAPPTGPPMLDVKVEDFLVRIEQELEEFLAELDNLFKGKMAIRFNEIVINRSRREAAKWFILILFAASMGKVTLSFEESDEDFLVVYNGEKPNGEESSVIDNSSPTLQR